MKTAKKYNPDLILHGNLIHAILSLAIPVVINSFLQTMYNLTDTYWLGKIGTEQLAAINLVTPMQNIITNFGSGITVAGAVLIAQYIGAGEKEDARSMANQIFICAMGFAVVCAALCFLGTPAIVNWLGADGGTAYYARVYLRVVIWDMPFLYMVNIFSAVHQAQGDTVRPMLLNLGGITLNRSVGGINPQAAERTAQMGEKMLWFPTLEARSYQQLRWHLYFCADRKMTFA